MEQTKNLTFADYPVTLRKIDGDVLIYCKKVIGLYSQALAFKNQTSVTGNYKFGITKSDICDVKRSVINRNKIHIACLEGTEDEMDSIIDECKSLMSV